MNKQKSTSLSRTQEIEAVDTSLIKRGLYELEEERSETRIRVMLVDDIDSIRENIHELIIDAEDMDLVASVGTSKEAIEIFPKALPSVMISDINRPDMDGIVATKIITDQYPDAKVIIHSVQRELDYQYHAQLAGAIEFVPKFPADAELLATIRRVHQTPSSRSKLYSAPTSIYFVFRSTDSWNGIKTDFGWIGDLRVGLGWRYSYSNGIFELHSNQVNYETISGIDPSSLQGIILDGPQHTISAVFNTFQKLEFVALKNSRASQATLEALSKEPAVRKLLISNSTLDHDVLNNIVGIHSLEVLVLENLDLRNQSLGSIIDLPNLKHLSLVGSDVSPTTIKDLKNRTELETLLTD